MARMRTAKVTKRSASSPKMTRQRSRLTPGSSSSTAALQNMVDTMDLMSSHPALDETNDDADDGMLGMSQEAQDMNMESQEYFDALSQPQEKGKGRLVLDSEEEQPFPLMDLPTEIRLEIYRACLTRPYKILLSRVEQRPLKGVEPATKEDGQAEGDTDELVETEMDLPDPANHQSQRVVYVPPQNPNVVGVNVNVANNARPVARIARPIRFPRSSATTPRLPTMSGQPNAGAVASAANTQNPAGNSRRNRRPVARVQSTYDTPTKGEDPLIINILRTSKEIYKEARGVLYSENVFDLDVGTAVTSLAALHQRSRRHIKHVELEIPTYTEILERFSEIVRLSLRYCTGLKKFVIHTPFTLPGADGSMSSSNTTVYANGFDILRWLPQQCKVILEGSHNAEIEAVVSKHLNLAKTQDKAQYYAFKPWLRTALGIAVQAVIVS